MTDLAKLAKLRQAAVRSSDLVQDETDRVRDLVNKKGARVYLPEFSWLVIRTTWENTRPGSSPIRVTCDGAYGIRSALAMAAHDLAWPRPDPHSRALKVEIFFDKTGEVDFFRGEGSAVLVAAITPPWEG